MTDMRLDLIHELASAATGEPWHGPSRATVLAGITASQAARQPGHGVHSIWEIVLHMRSWTREVMRRTLGGSPAEPEDGDWPAAPPLPTDAEWERALSSLEASHAELLETIRTLPTERFEEVVGSGDDPARKGITRRAMLLSLAQHDIYHTGQVALLKRIVADGER
ncbi:MAG: DinB family protein [Gemmatimonadaceae bacterium]